MIEQEKELGLTPEDYAEFRNPRVTPGTLKSRREYELVRVAMDEKMQDYFDMYKKLTGKDSNDDKLATTKVLNYINVMNMLD